MNTPSLMDGLRYTYLLTLCCFTFVCIYGKGQGLFPCEVELMVCRGTTWTAVPQQPLTVRCPVKHCGESLNVTWCKLLDTNKCERINYTENVEIKQDKRVEGELISYLTFTRISIHDNGLYRCTLKGHKYELISHNINISVSDLNQGVNISDYNADELPSAENNDDDDDDDDVPWLPYFSICVSIALLIVTLTALTLLSCYGCKRQLNHSEGQVMQITGSYRQLQEVTAPGQEVVQHHEKSTHMIPDLPIILHYTCSPSTAKRPPSQAPPMTNGKKPALANTADESQVSDRVVYAVVNHRQTGIPVREQHAETKQK